MKTFGIKGDLLNDGFRGYVKSVHIKKFKIEKGVKEFVSWVKRDYYLSGERFITNNLSEDGRTTLSSQWTITNDDGLLLGYNNFNQFNQIVSSGRFKYDYEGRIIEKYHGGNLEETYEYYENGNLNEIYYPSTGSRTIYEYDKKGSVIKELNLRGENNLLNLFNRPDKVITYYNRDRKGNIVDIKAYNFETDGLIFTEKYVVNNEGDEIEHICFKADGSIALHVFYEYEYDDNRNWTLRKISNEDRTVYEECTRQIRYADEFIIKRYEDKIKER